MEEKFGDLIKRLRIEKGYSVEELAELSGFSINQIKNIEKNQNKPRVFNIKKLAKALDCSFEYLFNKVK